MSNATKKVGNNDVAVFTTPKSHIKKGPWKDPVANPWALGDAVAPGDKPTLWVFNDAIHDVAKESRAAIEGIYAGQLIENKGNVGGLLNACRFLGIGDAVRSEDGTVVADHYSKGKDQKILREVRVGDWANTPGHAWLVAEVRYGIWIGTNTNAEKPDYVIDQTSFVDKKYGTLKVTTASDISILKYGSMAYTDPAVTALSEAQCDKIFKDEKTFDDNVRAFVKSCLAGKLTSENGKTPDGKDVASLTVREIKVINLKEFSSNGVWNKGKKKFALRGKVYVKGEYKDGAGEGKETTINNPLGRGISRAWVAPPTADGYTFVRFFDCKS